MRFVGEAVFCRGVAIKNMTGHHRQLEMKSLKLAKIESDW